MWFRKLKPHDAVTTDGPTARAGELQVLQQLIRYRLRPPGSKLIMTNILLSSRLATAFTRLFTARNASSQLSV